MPFVTRALRATLIVSVLNQGCNLGASESQEGRRGGRKEEGREKTKGAIGFPRLGLGGAGWVPLRGTLLLCALLFLATSCSRLPRTRFSSRTLCLLCSEPSLVWLWVHPARLSWAGIAQVISKGPG